MDVREFYDHALSERGFKSDEAQQRAIDRLQRAYEEWVTFKAQRSSTFKRLINRPDVPRGVYMWGGVGRGKSFLMDSFYSVVPVVRKTRVHFHEFMRDVHRQLDELKGIADPLDEVARRIARKYRLICFDEFHVSDIADAMILYNLLKGLFDSGVSFVMTSNYLPDNLYPDGLHRDRMMPTIQLLKDRLDVMNIDAGVDYRKRALEQVRITIRRWAPRLTVNCAMPSPASRKLLTKSRGCISRRAKFMPCAVPAPPSGLILRHCAVARAHKMTIWKSPAVFKLLSCRAFPACRQQCRRKRAVSLG